MTYEDLLKLADDEGLTVKEKPLAAHEGRIKGKRIAIKNDIPTAKKKCALAEELGHHYTTVGDIMDTENVNNYKQELRARAWGYNSIIGLTGILSAYKAGCSNLFDMAEYLDVSEEFLSEALEYYKRKYEKCAQVDNYLVCFEPFLGVVQLI